ncbi:alpha/beta hydrolase [Pseudonocardia sp. KRD-184]|uniref:Alpha/beta hydrolase n=1 Tax=Pseudonocardia oceani TaxID=2792013 RepID=A0ABS6U993_9PSEU|nr:alpha/beta hydrolase [Pseudonocardia oceani]MBW0090434.1 alpha/beta hydrolase [Pseudonocardia oceani]MBW0097221.1 alpha/beta hydrolase [Pseudonocardia oceani]MBW0110217.1 alpha/beta hydrolase [Pseudonocardia oceani]MBW0121485.1 alpha/beta hydrolase [Pseudonocardia oceani]MBW0128548.1 alpha/beta hydrolase [Pseudonocardia oceani]
MESGYADVNGLHMYYETHGEGGTPLVLLHGGVMTIDLTYADLIPALAERHRVIAVEFQAHGRTADIDRDMTYAALAGDVVALLDHLGVDRAHVMGHSMGGGTALELAVSHPDRLLSVVPISASVRPEGGHPDLADPSTYATSTRMPTAQDFADMSQAYARLAPHPERFEQLPMRTMATVEGWTGWTDEQLAAITAPVLVVLGDHDFTTAAHGTVMQELIPGSQLAILPGTTHMQAPRRADLLLPMLAAFLD